MGWQLRDGLFLNTVDSSMSSLPPHTWCTIWVPLSVQCTQAPSRKQADALLPAGLRLSSRHIEYHASPSKTFKFAKRSDGTRSTTKTNWSVCMFVCGPDTPERDRLPFADTNEKNFNRTCTFAYKEDVYYQTWYRSTCAA